MGFLELLLIGVGLSMDAFAVAVCQGLCMPKLNLRYAAVIALFFGGFQALMPYAGWLLGAQFAGYIQHLDHWLAFFLLAFIGGKMEDKISMHRLDGVIAVLKEHDVLLPREYVQTGESDCESGYRMTVQLLDSRKRPDAVICANNYIAYGCVMALHDRGILIPDEIRVITFDDYPFSQILRPMLSVVDIDVYDMGMQAGKYILQKIRKPNLYIQSHITVPSLIVRGST